MKNTILTIFLIFITGCGYTSVYKDFAKQDFHIVITDMLGDKNMNNLIKNQINLYSNKNSKNKFNVSVDTNYKKIVIAKDSAGVASDYQLKSETSFTIKINDNKTKTITFNEIINIKKKTDSFEQNIYEKNIKRNFASSLREKLVLEILTLR